MSKRWRVVLAAIVVLVAASVVSAVLLFDPNGQKGRIEQAVLRATGRQLQIAGPIRLRWSLTPGIEAADVSLANMPGGTRPEMATAARVQARLALLPLLTGHVELASATLVRPDILLETDAAGRGNWQFHRDAIPTPSASPTAPRPRETRPLDALRIEDGRLTWRDGINGRTSTVDIPRGRLDIGPDTAHAALTLRQDGADATLGAQLGTHPDGGWYPAKLAFATAGASLTLDGAFDPAARQVRGRGAAQAADLSQLSAWLQRPLPPLHDVRATGTLSGTAAPPTDVALHVGASDLGAAMPGAVLTALDVTWPANQPARLEATGTLSAAPWRIVSGAVPTAHGVALRGLSVTAALGDLAGDVAIMVAPRPSLRGTLVATRLDVDAIRALLASFPIAPPATASGPASSAPAPVEPARQVFSTRPLPWPLLRLADADLLLSAATIHAGGADYRNASAHLVLNGGVLQANPVTVQAPEGPVDLAASADASNPAPPVQFVLRSPGVGLDPLVRAFGLPGGSSGAAMLDVSVRAAGASPHDLAASLTGHLGVALVDGALSDAALAAAAGGVLHSAGVTLPPGGQSTVRCLALRLDAHDGQVTVTTLKLDTSRLLLDGSGSLDLGTETLALRLQPLVRIGGGGVAVPLLVDGPMLHPAMTVGAAAGSPGRFGVTIGGLTGPSDTCAPELTAARDGQAGPLPTAVASKAPKPADLLRSLLR